MNIMYFLNGFVIKQASKKLTHLLLLGSLICLSTATTLANNLIIGTPSVSGGNLQFSIQWDNSWRVSVGPANHDAVWIFVKRQNCGSANRTWDHALLNTSSASHGVSGGVLQINATSDGVGVFISRIANGTGNIASSTVTLALQTAANGTDNFQVFGIEMVYVPTGNFTIGDFGSSNRFNGVTITAATQAAGFANQIDYCVNAAQGSNGAPSLPPSYPQGYHAFYCMKYEISQEQYVKYLNALSFTQQAARCNVSPSSVPGTYAISGSSNNRHGIRIRTSGAFATIPAVFGNDLSANLTFDEAADGQNIACNYLSWNDLLTYLDWSGLRPMTEMEYEKTCRGVGAPTVIGEFAWGNSGFLQTSIAQVANPGQGSEISTLTGDGLCNFNNGGVANGPFRCGFAATTATSRLQAGAAYYGAMEMSGNLWEQCVGGNNFNYGSFTGLNGDGSISNAGLFDVAGWPINGGSQAGGSIRGGSFNNSINDARVSDRQANTNGGLQFANIGRTSSIGGRGVRGE